MAKVASSSTRTNATGWKVTLGIVFMSQIFSAVGFSMIFPFLPLYIQSLGSSTGLSVEFLSGMVISAQGFTMMISAPIWGIIADRYGRKNMVLRSMLGGSVILMMMAFVENAEQLVILRAIQGIVTGTVAANNALVAAVTPRERVGVAMGALQVGLWAGVALGPLIGGFLADAFGYSIPFLITAALLFLAGLTIGFGIHEDFEPPKNAVSMNPRGIWKEWNHIFKTPGVSMVFMMRFLAGVARTIIIPIAPLFVVSLLVDSDATSNTYAGLVLSVSSLTSTFGAVYLGNLGDKISHRTVLFWAAVASAVFYFPQTIVGDVWQLLFLQALTGIAAGGIIAAPSALLARYTEHGEEGAVYGLDNAVVAAARAVAPLVGAIVAMMFGLRGAFAASGIMFVVVALGAWFLLPRDAMDKAKNDEKLEPTSVP